MDILEMAYNRGYDSNQLGTLNPYQHGINLYYLWEQGLYDARRDEDECVKCGSPLGVSGECYCSKD